MSKERHCGVGKTVFLIPQFTFGDECEIHDDDYRKGGGIIEKTRADFKFYVGMLDDLIVENFCWKKKYLYFIAGTIYVLFVISPIGWFAFTWKINGIPVSYILREKFPFLKNYK